MNVWCKQGQVTGKEHRNAIGHGRGKICVVKGQLEIKQARIVGDNAKRFFQVH